MSPLVVRVMSLKMLTSAVAGPLPVYFQSSPHPHLCYQHRAKQVGKALKR